MSSLDKSSILSSLSVIVEWVLKSRNGTINHQINGQKFLMALNNQMIWGY